MRSLSGYSPKHMLYAVKTGKRFKYQDDDELSSESATLTSWFSHLSLTRGQKMQKSFYKAVRTYSAQNLYLHRLPHLIKVKIWDRYECVLTGSGDYSHPPRRASTRSRYVNCTPLILCDEIRFSISKIFIYELCMPACVCRLHCV